MAGASPAPRTEAKRQQENVRWLYGEDLSKRADLLMLQKREKLFQEQIMTFWSVSDTLLVWGQSLLTLDGNAPAAKATFAELAGWMPFFEESLLGPMNGHMERDVPGKIMRFDSHGMIAPVVCFLLAGDRTSLSRLARVEKEKVFAPPSTFIKDMRPWRELSFDLLDLLADAPQLALARPHTPIGTRDLIAGYDRMIAAIAKSDAREFEKARAAAETEFPKRSGRRETALNWYGEGKIAQAATFDAMGTALCRLASWRGIPVSVDTPLYPAYFHG